MKSLDLFKMVQFEDFFLVVGREVRKFEGLISDYIGDESEDYIECCYLTHKTKKYLSGLIR